jgi:succinoglycan biosynthesis transport protein ExoP
MQRAKETGISSELKTSNIRIVDQAEVPRAPISPNTPRGLLLGLVGGLIAGIGLGFFVEYLDNRVKNPDELKQGLGLSFLGLIPEARGPAIDPGHPPLLGGAVPEDFAEAFRVVRTSVLFSSAGEGGRSVVVTSTFPQEGKTVVAANLAIGLAQAGHRVLLIDADMRKPRQHALLGLSQDPGLSSLLVGRAKAKEAIRSTKVRNLWLIAAGPNPPNPAELLGADRFGDLLKALIRHFDWLVIDSPPVMAVTDSTVIAHRATGVVYVVGCERVSRRAVKSAIEQLTTSRATILGAVLNRVNVSRNPHYYSNYYRRDYSGYYRSEAKEQASG